MTSTDAGSTGTGSTGAGVRPFRFLADARVTGSGRELAERARQAEGSGIDVLVIPDHLIDQLAPIAYMATVAAATTTLRFSAFVHNNDLRHPAVLAQELASLDVLSEGRLEVAIGAGWNQAEYDAIGVPFEPPRVRQERLAEAITVLKGCFADGPFSFAGDHYTITDYDARPLPVQRPHPPFFIGGGGRRTLTLAGREVQTVGLAPRILPGPKLDPRSITVEATAEKIAWVREAAGDRFGEIELNVYPSSSPVLLTEKPRPHLQELAEQIVGRTGIAISADELADSPHVFIGSVQGLAEKWQRLRDELGISSVMVGEVGELAPVVELLAGS